MDNQQMMLLGAVAVGGFFLWQRSRNQPPRAAAPTAAPGRMASGAGRSRPRMGGGGGGGAGPPQGGRRPGGRPAASVDPRVLAMAQQAAQASNSAIDEGMGDVNTSPAVQARPYIVERSVTDDKGVTEVQLNTGDTAYVREGITGFSPYNNQPDATTEEYLSTIYDDQPWLTRIEDSTWHPGFDIVAQGALNELGDVNGDGVIDGRDRIAGLREMAQLTGSPIPQIYRDHFGI